MNIATPERPVRLKCVECMAPPMPGFRRCAVHLARDRARNRALWALRRAAQPKFEITLEHVLHDLRCVAERLKIRRVPQPLYEREGSFCLGTCRKFGFGWHALCVQAGLLVAKRGERWLDIRPCQRCHRDRPWNGPGDWWCRVCRRIILKRKCGLSPEEEVLMRTT